MELLKPSLGCWTLFLGLTFAIALQAQTAVKVSLSDLPPADGRTAGQPGQHRHVSPPVSHRRNDAPLPNARLAPKPFWLSVHASEQDALQALYAPLSTDTLRDATRPLVVTIDSVETQTGVDALYRDYLGTAQLGQPVRDSGLWGWRIKAWDSPDLGWHPLYFEEPNVERYGYHCGIFQPAVSGTRFITNAVWMPYKICSEPPCSCEYGLGYGRPGDCNPSLGHRRNCTPGGVVVQGLVVGGLAAGL
jgi:hypothetical protein